MPSFQSYLKAIKSEVAETDVGSLRGALAAPSAPTVIDVREQDEYVQGYIPGSRWIPRGYLELRIERAASRTVAHRRLCLCGHEVSFSAAIRSCFSPTARQAGCRG